MDGGNSVLVRLHPQLARVQCMGPDETRCSWYSGEFEKLAPGEPAPDPAKNKGLVCSYVAPTIRGSWCASAAGVFRGEAPASCHVHASSAAGSVIGRWRALKGGTATFLALAFMYYSY